LKHEKNSDLETQLKHVWTTLKEADKPVCVEDPANPAGNDLTNFVRSVWPELSARSRDTLDLLERSGWEAIFGPIGNEGDEEGKARAFVRAAAAVVTPTRPWLPEA